MTTGLDLSGEMSARDKQRSGRSGAGGKQLEEKHTLASNRHDAQCRIGELFATWTTLPQTVCRRHAGNVQ